MLGVGIGDALGKPNEITSPNLQKMRYGYRRAFKGHPNAMLQPGQLTDDIQIIIVAATLLADGRFNVAREIVEMLPITPIPRSPPYISGIINLRGEITTIINLTHLLGIPGKREGENQKNHCDGPGGGRRHQPGRDRR